MVGMSTVRDKNCVGWLHPSVENENLNLMASACRVPATLFFIRVLD